MTIAWRIKKHCKVIDKHLNDGENVFLMARTPIEMNSQLVIDAQSTALALVTMYPLFSSVDAKGYKDEEDFQDHMKDRIIKEIELLEMQDELISLSAQHTSDLDEQVRR